MFIEKQEEKLMALGDYSKNNDNNSKKTKEPIVYSPYGTSNVDGIDPSAISYHFYNGLLKISISPKKSNIKPGEQSFWDYENGISIWLTHSKAYMLLQEIEYVLEHKDTCINGGVATRSGGLISFSTGKELGCASPCLIIRTVNSEGVITASYAYQFKDNYEAVRNFDENTKYENIKYPNLEIEEFKTLLREYAISSCGATAYSVINNSKYETNKMQSRLSLIMDKLGIDTPKYTKQQSSFFNQSRPQNVNNYMNAPETSIDGLNGDEDEDLPFN